MRALWLLVFAFALATPRPGLGANPDICPRIKGKPTVYMLGSSTMGSTLGPMLKGQLRRKMEIRATRWGKASSGLARPDFHDWPGVSQGLMNKHRPDLVIVSLGTNDNQHIKLKRGWLHLAKDAKKWDKEYAKRVRQMLKRLSGKSQKRPVIWLGPVALKGKNARRNGPRITDILRQEIEAFEGQALLIDMYAQTVADNGDPRVFLNVGTSESPRRIKARSKDGQHLSIEAVQALMVDPILAMLADCEKGTGKKVENSVKGEAPTKATGPEVVAKEENETPPPAEKSGEPSGVDAE
ncbi:MAG: DUF459 domain-containing protein, partial [Myxococcota bacterium]|nr:DUF459 domain-containing protein [Myxococcota bacterium]